MLTSSVYAYQPSQAHVSRTKNVQHHLPAPEKQLARPYDSRSLLEVDNQPSHSAETNRSQVILAAATELHSSITDILQPADGHLHDNCKVVTNVSRTVWDELHQLLESNDQSEGLRSVLNVILLFKTQFRTN